MQTNEITSDSKSHCQEETKEVGCRGAGAQQTVLKQRLFGNIMFSLRLNKHQIGHGKISEWAFQGEQRPGLEKPQAECFQNWRSACLSTGKKTRALADRLVRACLAYG